MRKLTPAKSFAMDASVLLVSDDPETAQIWAYALSKRGLGVALVGSDQEAVDRQAKGVFDLIVIDVQTLQLDGIDLCRRLRAEAIVPILLFTPRRDEAYALKAYEAGVDECIVTPISPALFLAKVSAWLRRSWTVAAEALDTIQAGELRLDPVRRQAVTASGSVVRLTNLEFRLLHLLLCHQGLVIETDVIVDRVWGCTSIGDSVLLKNLVYRLRRKIEPDPSQPCHIQTVAGVGYAFHPQ